MFLRLKGCLIKEIKKIMNRTKIIPVPNRKRIFIKRVKIISYVLIYLRNIFKSCMKKLKSGILSRTIVKWNHSFNFLSEMSRTRRRWTAINNDIIKFSKNFYYSKYFLLFFLFFFWLFIFVHLRNFVRFNDRKIDNFLK
jgi:hypothetical protein